MLQGTCRLAAPIASAVLALAPPGQTDPAARDWIQLFNGRDLADWTIKFAKHDLGENVRDTFRVEDGLLKIRNFVAFDAARGVPLWRAIRVRLRRAIAHSTG